MKRTFSAGVFALLMGHLLCAAIARSAEETQTQQIPIDFPNVIASLKNNNQAPEISAGWRVVFPTNYDFREQRRVYKAIQMLHLYAEEAWPYLVRNLDNPNYSATLGFGSETYNYTIGDVCGQIIDNTLYAYHNSCVVHTKSTNTRIAHLKEAELVDREQLTDWLAERRNKSLLELQTDLIDKLRTKLPSLDMPDENKRVFMEDLDEHLENLRRRGYPQTASRFIPNRESWWYFTPEDASK